MFSRSTLSGNLHKTSGAHLALLTVLVLVEAILLLALSSAPADAATTFTVNKTGDVADRKITDAACDVSRKRGKQCTLRAALEEANDTFGADTINFRLGGTAPVKTINVGSSGLEPLPEIRDSVTINGYSQPGSKPNTLAAGNDAVLKIELNGSGAGLSDGLMITGGQNTIKGLVINNFEGDGIEISGIEARGNRVEGNFIGTDANGAEARDNDYGVKIDGSTSNTSGGTEPAQRNLISGNDQDDVLFNKEGGSLGSDPPTHNTVRNNIIANNTGRGVVISKGTGNSVLSNQIFSNGALRIDLGGSGVTANDLAANKDADTGSNNLQNLPVITSVSSGPIATTISGTLNSNPDQSYTIECHRSDGDPSDYGEGQALLDTTTIATDADGNANFVCVFPGRISGQVSATATNKTTGDTSEFSQNTS